MHSQSVELQVGSRSRVTSALNKCRAYYYIKPMVEFKRSAIFETREEEQALCANFLSPPEGGLDLVTYRLGAISLASAESPGPDWKPGSGVM